jgi:type IV secretion system protein VirB9
MSPILARPRRLLSVTLAPSFLLVASLVVPLALSSSVASASAPATPPGSLAAAAAAQAGKPAITADADVPVVRRRAAVRRARPASRTQATGTLATIAQANAQARDWPSPSAYDNSALYYDFEPGRLYTIHTSPRFLTTIALRPGEKLIAKAAGDTVRWVLGQTQAGSGEAVQVVVFVKPIRPDLRTNIVLTTDQRTYLIDAVSNASSVYTSVLSWNYPQEQAQDAAEQAQRAAAAVRGQALTQVAPDVAIARLNFRYAITPRGKRAPGWTPVRVFDDGTKTYIEFPADLATKAAPPLFLLGDKDRAELVNYRQAGVYYVIDRLVDRAELRLGEQRQDIVRITRAGGGH